VRLRTRLIQETVARVNQLHRLIDLGFPEFTRHLSDLNTELANAILRQYPTAQAFRVSRASVSRSLATMVATRWVLSLRNN